MEILYWTLLILSLYSYVLYPLILPIVALFYKHHRRLPQVTSTPPTVSILVPAFNESDNIKRKLDSLLSQNYPKNGFDIWVLNDGSQDNTGDIVRQYTDPRIHLVNLPRGGKAQALNYGAALSHREILVISDADTFWTPNTLISLVSPFSWPTVGGVAGQLIVQRQGTQLGFGDRLYRMLETFIRTQETRIGSTVSADGGLLAIRRTLYEPIPPDVTDDFFISTAAVLNKQSLVFQPSAIAYDAGVPQAPHQFRRRIRITIRGMNSLWRRKTLFNPFKFGCYALCIWSHKLLRRFTPIFLFCLLLTNAIIWPRSAFYLLTLCIQLLGYGAAISGLLYPRRTLPKPVIITSYLLLNNLAMAAGLLQFLLGKRIARWHPEQNR